MLKIKIFGSPDEKLTFLKGFSAENSTWIVSDLRSKLDIQRHILENQSGFEQEALLRVSELWKNLLRKGFPHMQVVSREFFESWLQYKRLSNEVPWPASFDPAMREWLELMMPVYLNPQTLNQFYDWLKKNPQSAHQWGHWFDWGLGWPQKLIDENRICEAWIPGFIDLALQYVKDGETAFSWSFGGRQVYFDLGLHMTQLEAEVIRKLSINNEITVLLDAPVDWKKYEVFYSPYLILEPGLESLIQKKTSSGETAAVTSAFVQTEKHSSELSEVKRATQIIRTWIDSGVNPQNISLFMSDPEYYWPVLKTFLSIEGIPCAKASRGKLTTFPAIRLWLNKIRMALGPEQFHVLETVFYAEQDQPSERFEHFYARLSQIMDLSDLKRKQEVREYYEKRKFDNKSMTAEQWVLRIMPFYFENSWFDANDSHYPAVERILKDLLSYQSESIRWPVEIWQELLEKMMVRQEIEVKPAQDEGVVINQLTAGSSYYATRRIYLGLTEKQLENNNFPFINLKDIRALHADLGYFLLPAEMSVKEFDIHWGLQKSGTQNYLFCPETDFSGNPCQPHKLWIQKSLTTAESTESHEGGTVYDFMKRHKIGVELLDFAEINETTVDFKGVVKSELSATSLERVLNCPFIYFAEKMLKMIDEPDMDIELDARSKGTLFHNSIKRIFEIGLSQITETQVDAIIDAEWEHGDHFEKWIIRSQKNIFKKKLLEFISFEKEQKLKFPLKVNLFHEKKIDAHFDLKTRKFLAKNESPDPDNKNLFRFTGVVDRIDGVLRDNSQTVNPADPIVIYDYKISPGEYKSFGAWEKLNQWQLAFYSWILSQSEALGEPRFVVGAFYYILKNLDLHKGFKIGSEAGLLFGVDKRKNQLSLDELQALFKTLEGQVDRVALIFKENQFNPQPRDADLCDKCQWNKLCRFRPR